MNNQNTFNFRCRDMMTRKEEMAYVEELFDYYEKEGFSKIFIPQSEDVIDEKYHSVPFKVIRRMKPELIEGDEGFENFNPNDSGWTELDLLPMWEIEFEDGKKIGAYENEIIPSKIMDNLPIYREEYNRKLLCD